MPSLHNVREIKFIQNFLMLLVSSGRLKTKFLRAGVGITA